MAMTEARPGPVWDCSAFSDWASARRPVDNIKRMCERRRGNVYRPNPKLKFSCKFFFALANRLNYAPKNNFF